MPSPYLGIVCRGCLYLGTGCGHCERCQDEKNLMMTKKEQALAAEQADTFQAPVAGLPVKGYKKEQPQWAVKLVNENKILEERVLRQIDRMQSMDCGPNGANPFDGRAVALAKTAVQDAFMWLNRAVFRPERITGDLD